MDIHNKSKREQEEQWFKEEERKIIEEMRRKRELKLKENKEKEVEAETAKLKELHYMHCPKCGNQMKLTSLQGIDIDTCPSCEGIFFDRGEIEQLLLKKSEESKGIFKRLLGL